MSFQIRIANSDAQFSCAADENVLDAALKAGIALPHSCRKGVCGNCAAAVVSGAHAVLPMASAEATPDGQTLLCQCQPREDLAIAPASWARTDPAARLRVTAKVFRNTEVAPDVNLLQLRLPPGKRARFRAGQYLQVLLPDQSRRAYSMANPPHESDTVQLHVRRVPGGAFSEIITRLQAGDPLELELPFGHVAIDPDGSAPLLCVCTGTGFAPVKSLLDDLVKRKSTRPVTLVWGARKAASLYLPSALAKWEKSLRDWRYVPALTQAEAAQSVGVFHGRVDAALRGLGQSLAEHEVYCCGSPAMVDTVRQVCTTELGLSATNFHSDAFVPGPQPVAP